MPECWDFDHMETMEEDCLKMMKIIFIDFYMRKSVKVCTYIFLLFHVPLWALQFFDYMRADMATLLKYGPTSLVFIFAFVSMTIPLAYKETIKEVINHMKKSFWPLQMGSPEIQVNILRKATIWIYIMKLNVLIAIVSYILFLRREVLTPEDEFVYQVKFLKERFPEYEHILSEIFLISLSYMVVPMIQSIYVFVYFALHMTFQVMLYNERIEKITEGFSNNIEMADDQAFRRQVSERLRFCTMRGSQLKSFAEHKLRIISPGCVTLLILSMLLVVCYVHNWYLEPNYPLIVAMCVASGYTGLVAAEMGHITEQESTRSYQLMMSLPWYNFSVSDQKSLLFLSLHAKIPLSVTGFEALPLNRTTIVQFYKIISSLSAVFAKMK